MSATDVVRGLRSLSSRDPLGYQPHRLHGHERTYQETNCSRLRISLYRECEQCIHETEVPITLRPHESTEINVETALGTFVDVSWAYRFGATRARPGRADAERRR